MSGRGKKRQVTEQQLKRAEEYAYYGCNNNTICALMEWNHNFLEDRPDILKRMTKKRAERKAWLLSQNKRIIESNQLGAAASTLIFTEKQSEQMGGLGFTDRPECAETSRPLVVVIGGTPEQVKQVENTVVGGKTEQIEGKKDKQK